MTRTLIIMACLVLIGTGTLCFADQWEFFNPSSVVSFGCTSRQVEDIPHGASHGRQVWQADAHAVRTSKEGNWEMTLGQFPASDKGRHAAEKVCSRWMDQASKRVKASR